MADLDPEQLGRSGIDPTTGSILSPDVRSALLKKTTIDTSVFTRQIQDIQNKKTEEDIQTARVIQNQEQAFFGFNSNIQALRSDIGKLGSGLASIALLLQRDGAEEKNRIEAEQERQRILAERKIRIGKEDDVEQKIQNAIVAPVQKLVPKVEDLFGNIKNALSILFLGWLTKEAVNDIQSAESKNANIFNDIKFNILKYIGIGIGGIFAIRTGFNLLTRTIGGIAAGLTKLFIAKPLALAAGLLRIPKVGGTTPTPPKTAGLLSSLVGLINTYMNFKNQEYTDAIMTIVPLLLPGMGPLGLVRNLVAAGAFADQIAEVFGSNLFGKNPNAKEIEKAARQESKNTKSNNAPPPPPELPPPNNTAAKPATSPVVTPQSIDTSTLRNTIESSWSSMTSEQQGNVMNWAASQGYNLNNINLGNYTLTTATKPKEDVNITPAQVTIPPKEPQKVGQLPEPKPTITMIKTSNNQISQPNPPLTNGPLTDVPLISSSNPDNFYVLYSQLSYNVVM